MKKIKNAVRLSIMICLLFGGCAANDHYVQDVDLNTVQRQENGQYIIEDNQSTRAAYKSAAKKQETGNSILSIVFFGGCLLLLL